MNGEAERLVIAVFLAFCRIGACFLVMPGTSSVRVPTQVRLFVALAATFAIFAHLSDSLLPVATRNMTVLVPAIAGELMVGGLIGLLARLYVMALQFMGTAIANLVGYGAAGGAAVEEPESQSPLASLISFSALLLLFVFDFHHEVVRALVESYRMVPVGAAFDARAALTDVTDTLSEAFQVTLRLGSPFVAYAILVNLAIGFINKLVPQIPVYFISQPFTIAGGLVLLYLGAGTLLSLFADGFVPVSLGK
ncbi:flagellar type III secretion system protein FliR [Mesorhizobium sp. RP14(2022)]|uniref:Flagellar biosynthetic protein FliR n=1 Tax=Mesorhizobium liriopis TaxID=2953882 RepID=A0ABT1C8D3_9HYPH|nr:flagellar biosynthetic protein FliR [Mesorhizobium liriopis]MCO6051070.1 flagellar type III secretion system protein FliR [Mesorhizobium liriopis]